MNLSPRSRTLFFLALCVATITADILVLRHRPLMASAPHEIWQLPVYTATELSRYDGTDASQPVYLALDGYVYDVTAGRNAFYGPGQPYHHLAGRDSSDLLHLAGGSIIKRKYSVVGIYTPL